MTTELATTTRTALSFPSIRFNGLLKQFLQFVGLVPSDIEQAIIDSFEYGDTWCLDNKSKKYELTNDQYDFFDLRRGSIYFQGTIGKYSPEVNIWGCIYQNEDRTCTSLDVGNKTKRLATQAIFNAISDRPTLLQLVTRTLAESNDQDPGQSPLPVPILPRRKRWD